MQLLYTTRGDMDRVILYARRLLELGKQDKDDEALMYGNNYMGLSRLMKNGDSILFYLNNALEIATEMESTRILASVYNGLGIYYVDIEMDYHKGLHYFMESLNIAKLTPHKRSYPIALSNLAMTYYMRNDPAGMKYAIETYEIGQKMNDDYIVFAGATNCAYMYYLQMDYEQAHEYISEALPMAERYDNEATVYSLYANILTKLGDSRLAEHYYKEALKHLETARVASAVGTYLDYATYLMGRGKNREAIEILGRGIELSSEKNNAAHRYLLYQRVSEAYSNMGDIDEAFRYFRIYHNEADSIFNVERERSINELRVKYDAEKQENEIKHNKIQLIQGQKKLQAMIMALAVILICLVAIYVLYRKKNKMYTQIVLQWRDFLKKEQRLKYLKSHTADSGDSDPAAQDTSEERHQELFAELERLMRNEQVYKEHDLSIEKLAEMLNTNRTYISRAINQQASMTFNNYVNSYRINEAVRILSDTETEYPLKALSNDLGFNHIQTFYSVFNGIVGMTPSIFRRKIIELNKGENI